MTIQKADPDARLKALWIVLIALVLGLCGLAAMESMQHRIVDWIGRNLEWLLDYPVIVFAVASLFILPVWCLDLYIRIRA